MISESSNKCDKKDVAAILQFMEADMLPTINDIAFPVLMLLSIGFFFSAGIGNTGLMLQLGGKQNVYSLSVFLTIVIYIGGNIITFIPLLGLIGVAVSSLTSVVIVNTIIIIVVYKEWKIQPFNRRYSLRNNKYYNRACCAIYHRFMVHRPLVLNKSIFQLFSLWDLKKKIKCL